MVQLPVHTADQGGLFWAVLGWAGLGYSGLLASALAEQGAAAAKVLCQAAGAASRGQQRVPLLIGWLRPPHPPPHLADAVSNLQRGAVEGSCNSLPSIVLGMCYSVPL